MPARGDLLNLNVTGGSKPVRFVCTGRRFDIAATDGPALRIDLELAAQGRHPAAAGDAVSSAQHHSLASVR